MRRSDLVLVGFALFGLLPALICVVKAAPEVNPPAATASAELRPETVGLRTDESTIARDEERISPDGFSVKELKVLREQAESFAFQAEVSRLMKIIINSLYSQNEIFLRELISNASDALDKIRFLSLRNSTELESGSKLEIRIRADPETRTLTITDTGIGMTKEELVKNLGTIAQSGTTEFLEKFKNANSDVSQIGQFGVGFYSAFLVADSVTVISKNNHNSKQHVWQSDSAGTFTVSEDPRGNVLGRGTSIILHLKEEAEEYLNQDTLQNLVTKYSQFINFPIYLYMSEEVEKEVPLTEEELKKQAEEAEEEELDMESEEIEEKPKTKTVTETVYKWELMNSVKPLWTRNPNDITEDEYKEFYKQLSKDTSDPSKWIHFVGEGDVEFKSLLYIPSKVPDHFYDGTRDRVGDVKLYVKRVFITDDFRDMLPKYLSFIKGIVDSDDLPLNVSREMLQESKILSAIKKKIVRKAIAMFQEMADDKENEEKYLEFWTQFGTALKLGVIEDPANRTRLSKLLLFHSSKTGNYTTLQDYVDRFKEGQTQIYYLAGETKDAVEHSPLLEKLVSKGYEVLYLTDPIDEYCISSLEKFDSKHKLTNIAREGLKIDGEEDSSDTSEDNKEKYKPLTAFLKKQLGSKIDRAVVSNRLEQSPSAVVAAQHGWTANMERLVKAQALGDPSKHQFYAPRKILEINPRHPLVKELLRRVEENEEDQTAKDIAGLLFETATLTSGFTLDDPASFAERVNHMLSVSLNLDPNAVVEPEAPSQHKETHKAEDHEDSAHEEL